MRLEGKGQGICSASVEGNINYKIEVPIKRRSVELPMSFSVFLPSSKKFKKNLWNHSTYNPTFVFYYRGFIMLEMTSLLRKKSCSGSISLEGTLIKPGCPTSWNLGPVYELCRSGSCQCILRANRSESKFKPKQAPWKSFSCFPYIFSSAMKLSSSCQSSISEMQLCNYIHSYSTKFWRGPLAIYAEQVLCSSTLGYSWNDDGWNGFIWCLSFVLKLWIESNERWFMQWSVVYRGDFKGLLIDHPSFFLCRLFYLTVFFFVPLHSCGRQEIRWKTAV